MALTIVRQLSSLNVCRQLAPLAAISASSCCQEKRQDLIVARPLQEDDIIVLKCSPSDTSGPDKNSNQKLPGYVLKEVQDFLLTQTQSFFTALPKHDMYHSQMVFEDRINNKAINGYMPYTSYLGLVKMYGHVRYAFVASQVQSSWITEENQSVGIHFKFHGMGMVPMAIKYFPKKLFIKDNLLQESTVWVEAISTFYINNEGKICRHVIDNKRVDQDKTVKSPVDKVKEKLAKLSPSPA